MAAREAKPIGSRDVRPPNRRSRWMAVIGTALFLALLATVILRPFVIRGDGPETGPPEVNAPATTTPAGAADADPTAS